MFIEITSPANPIKVENILRPYKNGKKEFTPEVAETILRMTNHPHNIRNMLRLIVNLPEKERTKYTDIVLSAFDHRAQPAENSMIAQTFSSAKSFQDNLNAHIAAAENFSYREDGIFYYSAADRKAYLITGKFDLSKHEHHSDIIYTNSRFEVYTGNFEHINSFKCPNIRCFKAQTSTNFPPDFDISAAEYIDLDHSDFRGCPELIFKKGKKISMIGMQGFPDNKLDLSTCSEVDLSFNDLSLAPPLKFKEGSKVTLQNCITPPDMDISMCDYVDLSLNRLQLYPYKFKKDSTIILRHNDIPRDFDISMCKKVDFTSAVFPHVKSLKFAKGSHIILNHCHNINIPLDFSDCDIVELAECDIKNIPSITFKNKQQQKESRIDIPQNWAGKIIYTEKTNFFTNFFRRKDSRN